MKPLKKFVFVPPEEWRPKHTCLLLERARRMGVRVVISEGSLSDLNNADAMIVVLGGRTPQFPILRALGEEARARSVPIEYAYPPPHGSLPRKWRRF